jgi:light-regulated signal transduction histidine kinase (bacteriophytochrome)
MTDASDLQARVHALEAALAASRAELQEFTYTVSHDLRAPLRHIVSFAKLLEEEAGPQLAGESLEFLQTLCGAADQMGKQLDALTVLSRLATVSVAASAVHVRAAVLNLVQKVAARYPGHAVQVVLDVPDALTVHTDEALLHQALEQVLDNAYKFTAKAAAAQVRIVADLLPDGALRLVVEDNGAGYNPALQDKLFKVFGRLHSAKQYPGLGTGLLVAQRVMALLGGHIHLLARPEGGVAAVLQLPSVQQA